MSISNYPSGFEGGLTLKEVPLTSVHPGKVFWVNTTTVIPATGKGPSNGNKGTYLQPFATIDYAIGKCTANRGDIIMVMPGSTETITTDGGIAVDVAGVAIIGLWNGTQRPKILIDAAAAAVGVSSANV